MENTTHTLLGVLLARAAVPWVGSLRGALWAAILASNAPDLDLLTSPFFADRKLGYLVHHRGHTHTIIGALALAVGVAAFARTRDRAARFGPLLVLSVVAALLHLGADAWNDYGVHPFWPIEDRWFYGDFIFILEPLLWLSLLPLAFTMAGPRLRIGLGALAIGMALATGWGLGVGVGAAWAAGLVALVGIHARLGETGSIALPSALVLTTLLAFRSGHDRADAQLREHMAAASPGERILDVVLTPRPATPWCWRAIVLSRDATTYHARTAHLSLAPTLTAPAACELRRVSGRTAPLAPVDLHDTPTVAWSGRFDAPVGELASLAATSCRVDAFMRYGRAPFWLEDDDHLVIGDLRYDHEPALGFAEVEASRTDGAHALGCGHLPPWRSEVARELLEVPGG